MSEWYSGPMEIRETVLFTEAPGGIWQEWICPQCHEGSMIANGITWPTTDPGFHHTCLSCKRDLAIHKDKYPRVVRPALRRSAGHE